MVSMFEVMFRTLKITVSEFDDVDSDDVLLSSVKVMRPC
jgi:hypothetical protein